ncbi:polysaccharide deacetylase family protein [uncultured Methanobacterium sp.]|uniref:polysaccharide deacetylase family protein n=1 Tax=uncultured Methanobacterium sp. TaxID=176306 RepID=UPI002AA95959|nr:polysaccharide deacetylase family protein [uncultured Methanobacterium sp.]
MEKNQFIHLIWVKVVFGIMFIENLILYCDYIRLMLTKIFDIANSMKLFDIFANGSKSKVAILTYHRICNKNDDWSLNPLPVKSFKEHLKFLTDSYNIISLDDLVDLVEKKEPIYEKTAVLTFDDGYKDNYTNAYPLLEKYDIPATIYLTSKLIGTDELVWADKVGYIIYHSLVDHIKIDELSEYNLGSKFDKYQTFSLIKRKLGDLSELEKSSFIDKLANLCEVEIPADAGCELMLSWEEVKEMDENNIVFGAHTINHPVLPELTPKEAKWEILESKRVLEKNLQKKVNHFSYPYGTFNQGVVNIVKDLKFKSAVTLDQNLINTRKDDLYTLSRMDGFADLNFLKLFLSGYGDYFYYFVKLKSKIIANNPRLNKMIMGSG